MYGSSYSSTFKVKQDETFGIAEPHTVWGLSKCLKEFVIIAYEYMFTYTHIHTYVVMLKYDINYENSPVFIIMPSKILQNSNLT